MLAAASAGRIAAPRGVMAAPLAAQPGWPHAAHGSKRSAAATDSCVLPPGPSLHQQQALYATQQPPRQTANSVRMSDSESDSDSGPLRVPLKLVVQDAVKRWFNECLSEARRGDVKQQALLAQMLAEGYGCKQDLEESRRWAERARLRGYTMSGVYCEL